MAPTPATAAGTAEPTARNLEATATPQDSPSAERATIEKVMIGPYRQRLCSTGLQVAGCPGARPRDRQARLPLARRAPSVRRCDRHRRDRQRRVHADLDALLPGHDRPEPRADRRRDLG